jgi:hypothetical protein
MTSKLKSSELVRRRINYYNNKVKDPGGINNIIIIKEAIRDEVEATNSTIEGKWKVGEIPEEYAKPTQIMLKRVENEKAKQRKNRKRSASQEQSEDEENKSD